MRTQTRSHDLESEPFPGVEDMVGTKIPMNKGPGEVEDNYCVLLLLYFMPPFPYDGVLLLSHRDTRPISLIASDKRDY